MALRSLCVVLALSLPAAAHAAPVVTYTKLVDIFDGIGGRDASYVEYANIDGDNYVFSALVTPTSGSGFYPAVYASIGGTLHLIEGPSASLGFTGLSIKGDTVSYIASNTSGVQTLYKWRPGEGRTPVVSSTALVPPGNTETFHSLGSPSAPPAFDGGRFSFLGGSPSGSGVYSIADTGGAITDLSNGFSSIGSFDAGGGATVFQTNGGIHGVSSTGGSTYALADTSTAVPGGSGTFANFGNVAADDTYAYFYAHNMTEGGLYRVPLAGGVLEPLIERGDLLPGGGTYFSSFNTAAGDGTVAFKSFAGSSEAIYAIIDGSVARIVVEGQILPDQEEASSFQLMRDGVSGDRVIFAVNTTALYAADLSFTVTWEGGDGAWTSANNWLQSQLPEFDNHAVIATNGDLTVNGPAATQTVRSLQLGGLGGLNQLVLNPIGTLNVLDDVRIEDGGLLRGAGTVIGDIDVATTGVIEAQGVMLLGDAASTAGFRNAGLVKVGAHTVVIQDADRAELPGILTITGGTLVVSNGLHVQEGGQLAGYGVVSGDVLNEGTVAGGTGGDFLNLTGFVTGVGSYTGNVQFSGTASFGASPAVVTFDNARFSGGATLIIEIAGIDSGEFDQLVGDSLTLGGKLTIVLLGGFTPEMGDTFELFQFAQLDGGFSTIELPELSNGLFWDDSTLELDGILRVVPEPTTVALLALGGVAIFACRRR